MSRRYQTPLCCVGLLLAITTLVGLCYLRQTRSHGASHGLGPVFANKAAEIRLVRKAVGAHDRDLQPSTYGGQTRVDIEDERVPGYVRVRHFEPLYDIRTSRYRAIIGEVSPNYKSVIIHTINWHRIGKIRALPRYCRRIEAAWNSDGSRLAVACACRNTIEVGTVTPRSPTFHRAASIKRRNFLMDRLYWTNSGLYVLGYVTNPKANIIYEINKKAHVVSKLFVLAGKGIAQTAVSPDGIHLAFDIGPIGYDRYGIWIVNLSTGHGEQVTFETGQYYWHHLVKWTGRTRLLFVRYPDQLYEVKFATLF